MGDFLIDDQSTCQHTVHLIQLGTWLLLKESYENINGILWTLVAGFWAGGCVSIADSRTSLLTGPLVTLAYLWSFGNFLYKLVAFSRSVHDKRI